MRDCSHGRIVIEPNPTPENAILIARPRRFTNHEPTTAEMMTVLAVAGQRVRLRPASAEPVTIIPAVTQRPAGGLPMLVEVRS